MKVRCRNCKKLVDKEKTIVHTSKPKIFDVITQEIVDSLAKQSNPFGIHCSTQKETHRVLIWLSGDSRYENVHIDSDGTIFVELAGSRFNA
jgi:hypothetical protein